MESQEETPSELHPKLTKYEKLFCEYYVNNNQTAVHAVFSAYGRNTRSGKPRSYGSARVKAHRLLTKANIKAEIQVLQRELHSSLRVSPRRVLREIAAMAFSNAGDLFIEDEHSGLPKAKPWDQVNPQAKKALASVKVKVLKVKNIGEGESAVQEMTQEVEYKFHNKGDAIAKLCQRLGLLDAVKNLAHMTQEERVAAAERAIDNAISRGDAGAARFVLETQGKSLGYVGQQKDRPRPDLDILMESLPESLRVALQAEIEKLTTGVNNEPIAGSPTPTEQGPASAGH